MNRPDPGPERPSARKKIMGDCDIEFPFFQKK